MAGEKLQRVYSGRLCDAFIEEGARSPGDGAAGIRGLNKVAGRSCLVDGL
jgi:hypothetical protein